MIIFVNFKKMKIFNFTKFHKFGNLDPNLILKLKFRDKYLYNG